MDCNHFPAYVIILGIGNVIASTARTGNTLITLRCVEPKDKSFALGVIGSLMAVFAFIPYPLIFGAITDSTCLIWEKACGKTGNCWVYDMDQFRYYLHGTAFAFMMIGSLFDIGVILKANQMKHLYDEEEEEAGEEGEEEIRRIELKPMVGEKGSEDILFSRPSTRPWTRPTVNNGAPPSVPAPAPVGVAFE
jgi:hypothetical protein